MGTDARVRVAVEQSLQRHASTFTAASVVVVGRDGRVEAGVNAAADTPFDLASLTKPFTAFGVLHAHVLGLIDIDAPVATWIPEWKAGAERGVTARDLLAHRSWLPASPRSSGAPGTPWSELDTRAFASDPWAVIYALPLIRPETPFSGTHGLARYSDAGYMLLGQLLERATGTTLEAALSDLVAQPLGISLRAGACAGAPGNGAGAEGGVHDPAARLLGGLGGHAGLFADANAVAVLADAFRIGAVIGANLARQATAPHSRGTDGNFGLGWMLPWTTDTATAALSARRYGHNGFTGTSVWVDQTRDLTIVLLTNRVATGATTEAIRALRADLHQSVISALEPRQLG